MASLFKSPRYPTRPVVAKKKTVMPLPDDDAVKKARKRSYAAQRRRSGRMSTILSQSASGGTLGGP